MSHYSSTRSVPTGNGSADHFLSAPAGEPVCTIGDLARRFDLTHRALRFYESRGLLNPMRRGSSRLYGARDLERLSVIVKAKKFGLTLSAIEKILRNADSEQTLRLSRETCLAQIAVLERKLAQTQEALAELRAMCGVSGDRRPDR